LIQAGGLLVIGAEYSLETGIVDFLRRRPWERVIGCASRDADADAPSLANGARFMILPFAAASVVVLVRREQFAG
jgi:hypothetical protein